MTLLYAIHGIVPNPGKREVLLFIGGHGLMGGRKLNFIGVDGPIGLKKDYFGAEMIALALNKNIGITFYAAVFAQDSCFAGSTTSRIFEDRGFEVTAADLIREYKPFRKGRPFALDKQHLAMLNKDPGTWDTHEDGNFNSWLLGTSRFLGLPATIEGDNNPMYVSGVMISDAEVQQAEVFNCGPQDTTAITPTDDFKCEGICGHTSTPVSTWKLLHAHIRGVIGVSSVPFNKGGGTTNLAQTYITLTGPLMMNGNKDGESPMLPQDKNGKTFLEYAKATKIHRQLIDVKAKSIGKHMEMIYLWGDRYLAENWPVDAFWPP